MCFPVSRGNKTKNEIIHYCLFFSTPTGSLWNKMYRRRAVSVIFRPVTPPTSIGFWNRSRSVQIHPDSIWRRSHLRLGLLLHWFASIVFLFKPETFTPLFVPLAKSLNCYLCKHSTYASPSYSDSASHAFFPTYYRRKNFAFIVF